MTDLVSILLVEDNQDDYEATARSFKKNHVLNPLVWCRGGEDALDYLFQRGQYANDPAVRRPSLILLDLNMPGLDGRKVLHAVKASPQTQAIPVVVLTTSKDEKDIQSCYEIGASTYIQKPVSYDGLCDAVQKLKDYWLGVAILPKETT